MKTQLYITRFRHRQYDTLRTGSATLPAGTERETQLIECGKSAGLEADKLPCGGLAFYDKPHFGARQDFYVSA
jgi:hypothetical protein